MRTALTRHARNAPAPARRSLSASRGAAATKTQPVAVVVVHRHGDRAPGFNFFGPGEREEEERTAWTQKLPPRNVVEALAEAFPRRDVDARRGLPARDPELVYKSQETGVPFGALTEKGVSQLVRVGAALRGEFGAPASPEEVYVRSTDFERTVTSARAALAGWTMGRLPVKVNAMPKAVDTLNPWEVDVSLRARAADVWRAGLMGQRESLPEVQRARNALVKHLPAYSANPARFNWAWACDYYVTRKNHKDAIAVPELAEFEKTTLDMAMLQFSTAYGDPVIGAAVSQHLLVGMLATFLEKFGDGEFAARVRERLPTHIDLPSQARFFLVSGHDITIIPLLVAFGAEGFVPDTVSYDDFWPTYGSRFVVELTPDGRVRAEFANRVDVEPRLVADLSLPDFVRMVERWCFVAPREALVSSSSSSRLVG